MKIIYGLLIAVTVLGACSSDGNNSSFDILKAIMGEQKKEVKEKKVDMVKVSKGNIANYLDETGAVVPRTIIKVKFDISGKITYLRKEEGDFVEAGEEIAVIVPDLTQVKQYAAAEIAYKQALANLESAKNELNESKGLFDQGLVNRSKFTSDKSAYDIAKSEVDKTLMELNSLKQSGTISEGQGISIKAPARGTVIKRYVDIGDYVMAASTFQSGTVLYDIANINDVIVESKINEMDILNIKQNSLVDISIEAIPNKSFQGRVFRVFPQPETVDSVKRYNIQVNPLSGFPNGVKPGMTCQIRVLTVKKDDVSTLPLSAVVRDEMTKKDYVLIPYYNSDDPSKKYQKLSIQVGVKDPENIEILSGLVEGDEVVRAPYEIPDNIIFSTETNNQSGSGDRRRRPPRVGL